MLRITFIATFINQRTYSSLSNKLVISSKLKTSPYAYFWPTFSTSAERELSLGHQKNTYLCQIVNNNLLLKMSDLVFNTYWPMVSK